MTATSNVSPSSTARGRAWLSNFDAADVPTAEFLLDSLDIASLQEVRNGIADFMNFLQASSTEPTVAIPIVPIEDIPNRPPRSGRHIAYESYQPGGRLAATPGSEGLIGNAIREFTGDRPARRAKPQRWLHPATGLKRLRELRVRRFLLVTDYAGSGQQAVEFARTFTRHRTVRSWRSYGLVRISVLCYAATSLARDRLEEESSIDEVHVCRPAASFSSVAWTDSERDAVRDLFDRYLDADERADALGYRHSGGLFATHSRVPNNLPILLRRRTRADWRGFFEKRVFPRDLIDELGTYTSRRDLVGVTLRARQIRISRVLQRGRFRTPADRLIAVLALLALRRHSQADLSEILHVPEARVRECLDFLRRSGMVSASYALTDEGIRELKAAKRLSRAVPPRPISEETYYPQALR